MVPHMLKMPDWLVWISDFKNNFNDYFHIKKKKTLSSNAYTLHTYNINKACLFPNFISEYHRNEEQLLSNYKWSRDKAHRTYLRQRLINQGTIICFNFPLPPSILHKTMCLCINLHRNQPQKSI